MSRWATWVYHADVTNDGTNSGNHLYVVQPGAGNEMELLYGSLANDDAWPEVRKSSSLTEPVWLMAPNNLPD